MMMFIITKLTTGTTTCKRYFKSLSKNYNKAMRKKTFYLVVLILALLPAISKAQTIAVNSASTENTQYAYKAYGFTWEEYTQRWVTEIKLYQAIPVVFDGNTITLKDELIKVVIQLTKLKDWDNTSYSFDATDNKGRNCLVEFVKSKDGNWTLLVTYDDSLGLEYFMTSTWTSVLASIENLASRE